ncbi:hypothetical protein MSG28_006783 [Choristoneura fumiferana]|uniref:Uncharacterized protein n=1 Tax=Choristoneura fumiferana TaxID=7141 RepID=A0ACC0JLG0_CHOFU|nr:hypothetical protein MSG28_006783 [Choristoneura fumiferana]
MARTVAEKADASMGINCNNKVRGLGRCLRGRGAARGAGWTQRRAERPGLITVGHTVAARAPRRTPREVTLSDASDSDAPRAVFCATPATTLDLADVNSSHVPTRKRRGGRMATKGKRPMRALTPGDKIEAIQRVNDGESKASVARDIGVPESTLRGWCKNEDKLRYMTSRLSSPDTDKSSDTEPLDKRARTESPAAPEPAPRGLDLSAPAPAPRPAPARRRRARRAHHAPRARARPRARAAVSMSAISPLSGLTHIPGLAHSHLGLSFNEIATNLTLLAQLNPGLSTLAAQPASRALRSVRSPKPAHNGHGSADSKHRSKAHHYADPYTRHGSSKSGHHVSSTTASQPVDDTLWYWLKTQQAMLDLSAQTTAAHPLQLKTSEQSLPPKPAAPTVPIASHLDYNRNSWLWQYYKQFGGAMPLPEDKLKPASQVPKEKSSENILYSHLTKGKTEERASTSPEQPTQPAANGEVREPSGVAERVASPAASPGAGAGAENKEPAGAKARTVLDSLLFNDGLGGARAAAGGAGAGDAGAAEALQHGDKFLAWLEASGDPAVTRMHVHQLRALLHNLRARRAPRDPHH